MIDALGRPIDGRGALAEVRWRPLESDPVGSVTRARIERPLDLGLRALNTFATVGQGMRLGIFAGSGVGKSSLLGQITRGTDADVVVCCLVGERGREVRGFVEEVLGEDGRSKSVLVVATSDRAPIERYLAPFVAVTVAEHFRDEGKDVLL
ncbi:MAG: EscN/YscN/HrcN family type III secretion system ATPase, partial [Myxococcales bacterium]|nr:EscN/YscN/HrcN family type III secretion system ATPase [Myxococcales bacterium]